ncbi:hypothetical protein COE80_19370 [Bacillus pseudomycoides]|uniref:nucleoside triphosphate pyrophosphohydrolase family protein n=1 Tax=Bacillus pseudomycoides TaxID=64104 RepID=UPI000BFB1747|nr:nucleoside triphosphate pyrophosphohydrolase family protein [Bacillus pseudomycoides]PHB23074.1 hypothetical protein COE80_19370 [Bacillus pseudomycoides]PHE37603.1 hypothetical protein COF51_16335 [Bacillus pseudomycoides]
MKIEYLDDYQEKALRTWNTKGNKTLLASNAALGLTGEAGECADIVKKEHYHLHEIDPQEMKKELGDTLYYLAVLASEYGFTLRDIAETNIEKLSKRYPEGFNSEASIKRVDVQGDE